MKEITVAELKQEIESNDPHHIIVDVRTPEERSNTRIQGTINIPMSRIPEQLDLLHKYDAVYVHCGTGGRSSKVCADLSEHGLPNVVNVKGGVTAWEAAGFTVIGGGRLSILRQVRIAAGAFVLLGVLGAMFVHQYFLGVSAFVACGLMYSGFTGTCGMAWVLLKMPWNKV